MNPKRGESRNEKPRKENRERVDCCHSICQFERLDIRGANSARVGFQEMRGCIFRVSEAGRDFSLMTLVGD